MSCIHDDVSSLHLPRILCLHGGGTNARIFRAQCRGLIRQLRSEFRLVFAEAPFPSQAGPDVTAVYGGWGPFKRWLRWLPEHAPLTHEETVEAIDRSLSEAMREDTLKGATGEWIALLGFSQGAKLCASLLYRQQVQLQQTAAAGFLSSCVSLSSSASSSSSSLSSVACPPYYRFGVLLAGRAPLIALDTNRNLTPTLPDSSQITDAGIAAGAIGPNQLSRAVLCVPTVHVHGLRDKGLPLHRQLLEQFCDATSAVHVQWDGDHRVPLRVSDVSLVAHQIRALFKQTAAAPSFTSATWPY